MPVGRNGDGLSMGTNSDVALLKRVYENAAVMALKRRYDGVDTTRTGFMRRADYTRGYHQLCPWDDRMLTKSLLVGEFDEIANGVQEISFIPFLIGAAVRHPKALLPDHALAFINRKVEQAIIENPVLVNEKDSLRKDEIAAFVKSLYGNLEFPSFATAAFGAPILAPIGKGHGVGISQDKIQPIQVDIRLGSLMDAHGLHHLATSILSTGMLPLDVEVEILEKELQSLPFELSTRNGETKHTESLILYHAQEMNAAHITFEAPAQLGVALSLICELEQLQGDEEAAWEEKLRLSDIPGAAYQYIMLLQCDELFDNNLESLDPLSDSPAAVSSLDSVVIPLSEAICASNLCAGAQDLVIFYRDVETELQAMVSGVTVEERKIRPRSIAGSFGSHCFRHIRQLEHEEVFFESPEHLVAALRLLVQLPELEPAQVEEKLKRLGLHEPAKKYIREKTQLQLAKAKAVRAIMESVLGAVVAAPQLVKPNATDLGSFEPILTRMLQESRQLDDKGMQALNETVVQLQANYVRHISRMEASLNREFSTYAQVAIALNFLCMPNLNPEALALSSLSDTVKRFIERADRTVVRILPNVSENLQDKERVVGFDMLVNNYWAASAQVDAGINGVREMVRALYRMYNHNKIAAPVPAHALFKGRSTPGKPGYDDGKDDEDWSFTGGSDYDHMPTYKKSTEVSRVAFDSAIKAHFRFMKSVNAGVIAPLQTFLDNQSQNKRKLDEAARSLEAQIKQGRTTLNDEQRNCELAYSALKDDVRKEQGKRDSAASRHKKDKIGVRRAKVAEMFKSHEANVFQIARVENIIKQQEIAVRLKQLEDMERYRQAIVTTHVDKLASIYHSYVSELQEHDDALMSSVERLKNNNDIANAVKQWLREVGPDPIAYRLPCRPEQILSMEVGEQLPEERLSGESGTPGVKDWHGGSNGVSDLATIHSGSLKKKNQATSNITIQWATRYFILRLEPDGKKYTLNYYHSLDDAAKRHILPEVIPLDQVEYLVTTLNKKQRNPEDNYRFDLKLRAGARSLERAELCLRAETKEQCLVWVARLQEAGVMVKDEIQTSALESPETENELTNAQLTTKILYEGSIKKKSTSRHGHIWLSRHFVLRSNNVLYYYDGASDAKHLRNPRWLKAEDIAEIHIPDSGKGAQDGVRLNLTMRNSIRTFDLLAADPASCQEWCRQLAAVIHVDPPVFPEQARQSISSSRPPITPAPEKKSGAFSSTSPKAFSPKGILPALHDNRLVGVTSPRTAAPIVAPVRVIPETPRGSDDGPDRKKPSSSVRESYSGMFSMKPPTSEEPRRSFTAGLKDFGRDSLHTVKALAQRHSKMQPARPANDAQEEDMSSMEDLSTEDAALAQNFERCLTSVIKTRLQPFKARRVQDCFTGKDAISAMINSGMGKDRKEAVDIGNRLLRLNVFFCVDKNTGDFRDSDKTLYRLERDAGESRMSLSDYRRSTSGAEAFGRSYEDRERSSHEDRSESTAGDAYQPVRKQSNKKNPPPPPPQANNSASGRRQPPRRNTVPAHHSVASKPVGIPTITTILEPQQSLSEMSSFSSTTSIPHTRRVESETNSITNSEESKSSSHKDEPATPEAVKEPGVHKLRFSISKTEKADTHDEENSPLGRVVTFECNYCGEKLEGVEEMCSLCAQNADGGPGVELVIQMESSS